VNDIYWNEERLERALADLSSAVEFPETPDVAPAVMARIATRRAVPVRRAALAGLAAALIGSAVLVASPAARTAVADFLGIGGVKVTFNGEVPDPTLRLEDVDLGPPVTLAEAQRRVRFEIQVLGALGAPEAVYAGGPFRGRQVTLVYASRAGLPELGGTGVGLLLTQVEGVEPGGFAEKTLEPGTAIERVAVGESEGMWIEGEHALSIAGDVRPAGSALLWERDGVTYRIESRLGRAEAVAVAESLEAPGATFPHF
jgi:hypothetical protein